MSHLRRLVVLVALAWLFGSANAAWAVDPNPLENAYWRFEEGANGAVVPDPNPAADSGATDPVLDSANNNRLRKSAGTPTYTSLAAPKPLKSGLANNRAMSFSPNSALITSLRNIDNGTPTPGDGFTIEAAFRANSVNFNPFSPAPYAGILSKQSEPADGTPDPIVSNLPTAALKIRGDNGKLMFEQFDEGRNLANVSSQAVMQPNNWYYAAVVNDGSTLSLWLDSGDGNGYQLQQSAGLSGAIYLGDPENPQFPTISNTTYPYWFGSWTVGRGYFAGAADWFDGIIDEVRLTNTALDPADFLFAPPAENGDFNHDHVVDSRDYVLWRKIYSNDPNKYELWRHTYGQTVAGSGGASPTPEPMCCALAIAAFVAFAPFHRRRTS